MLPVKKIYIDSRHSTPDSISSSKFKIELLDSYKMPPDTVFYICEVCIPHAWKTVEECMNDKLYFQVSRHGGDYIATIDADSYDGNGFKLALYDAIKCSMSWHNNILYYSRASIKIYTDPEIKSEASSSWTGGSYSGGNTGSCNENIQNF